MRTFLAVLLASFMVIPMHANGKKVRVTARVNTPVISVHGGKVYVHVTVETPFIKRSQRDPLNLTVVLDRSGSMGDEKKMDFARKALHRLIDNLSRNDMFALVIYDDEIEVLQRPSRVTDKRRLHSLVDEIQPRGATNLGGGLKEGLRLAADSKRKGVANRVILLSDGLANRGVTAPRELSGIVHSYRRSSISVTTMGVGLDYNENLMVGLAESGGGNYYFIESPSTLASIMNREFDAVSSIVCRDATLEIRLGRGVSLKDVIGHEWKSLGNTGSVRLGDLYQDDQREFTVELSIPEGTDPMEVFAGTLAFEGDLVEKQSEAARASIAYSRNDKEIDLKRDLEVQGRADVAVSTRKVEQALQALDSGDKERASADLDDAMNVLSESPAAASGAGGEYIRQQIGRLETFKDSVEQSGARRAKKTIQYENYKLLKNKK